MADQSMHLSEYDVVVVGAGMVGSAFAALLADSGAGHAVKIALIEANKFVAPEGEGFDPRVVALTEASRKMLAQIGVWQEIEGVRVCPYTGMQVWDAEGTGRIEFDCEEIRQPNLGHIVENSVIVAALLRKIEQLESVDLLCPASVENISSNETGVDISLADGTVLRADLLVAADGAMSRVRDMAGLKMREWAYGHTAIVTTITTEKPHQFTARQRFMAAGPLAFLPLRAIDGNCHHCSLVWSQKTEAAGELMALTDEEFCRQLGYASEFCLGNITAVEKRFSFPLRQRHAIDYIRPGLALVGDAAHTIHPLAGQGVNLGFQDVMTLVEEVTTALDKGMSPGDPLVLGRYQRRRKPHNLGMMAAMEAFKRLFEEEALPIKLLRNIGMSGVNAVAPLKNELIRRAMGL